MNEERINASEQSEMFSLIGRTLKNKVECYAVGGTALMFLGLKETTKDVDLLFKKNEDYENLRKALHNLGAKESKTNIINPEKVSSIITLGNARFDLFFEHLIHFRLTESIIARIKESHEFSNLSIKIISPEDIILFKSMADRESDRIDVNEIIKKMNINWKMILEEVKEQKKNSEYFFEAFLYNFLLGLKDSFKTEIPKEFMEKLEKETGKALLEAQKRLSKL